VFGILQNLSDSERRLAAPAPADVNMAHAAPDAHDDAGEWHAVHPISLKAHFWVARGPRAEFVVRGGTQYSVPCCVVRGGVRPARARACG
jgi:hypothetical protein